jgi:hypothetical protein
MAAGALDILEKARTRDANVASNNCDPIVPPHIVLPKIMARFYRSCHSVAVGNPRVVRETIDVIVGVARENFYDAKLVSDDVGGDPRGVPGAYLDKVLDAFNVAAHEAYEVFLSEQNKSDVAGVSPRVVELNAKIGRPCPLEGFVHEFTPSGSVGAEFFFGDDVEGLRAHTAKQERKFNWFLMSMFAVTFAVIILNTCLDRYAVTTFGVQSGRIACLSRFAETAVLVGQQNTRRMLSSSPNLYRLLTWPFHLGLVSPIGTDRFFALNGTNIKDMNPGDQASYDLFANAVYAWAGVFSAVYFGFFILAGCKARNKSALRKALAKAKQ